MDRLLFFPRLKALLGMLSLALMLSMPTYSYGQVNGPYNTVWNGQAWLLHYYDPSTKDYVLYNRVSGNSEMSQVFWFLSGVNGGNQAPDREAFFRIWEMAKRNPLSNRAHDAHVLKQLNLAFQNVHRTSKTIERELEIWRNDQAILAAAKVRRAQAAATLVTCDLLFQPTVIN